MASQRLRTDVEVDASGAVKGLTDLGTSADRAATDVQALAKELRQSERPMKSFGDTADAAGDDVERTGRRVEDAMDDSRDSVTGAASAMGEAFGQGGSATDAAGSFSEVVESISESFGPFGPAVALAGGFIIGMFTQASQKADELRQKAHDVFDELVAGSGVLDAAYRQQAIQQFVKDNGDLVETVGRLLGPQGLKDLGDAVGGNDAAYQSLNRRVETTLAQMKQQKRDLEALTLAGTPLTAQQQTQLENINDQIPVYEDLNNKIDENAGVMGEAHHELQLFNGMMGVASSSMGAYTQSVTTNATALQRDIGWQLQQTSALYDAATAAAVARRNVELLNAAYASRAARGDAPEGPASYIEGVGWVYNSGPKRGQRVPGRAAGGPVEAGTAYRVGEYGAETFVPATDGTIVPGGTTGGTVTVNQTVVTNDPVRVAQRTAEALRRQAWRTGRG